MTEVKDRDEYILRTYIFFVSPKLINKRFNYNDLREKHPSLLTITDFIVDGDWDISDTYIEELPFYKFIKRVHDTGKSFKECYSEQDKEDKQRHLLYEDTYKSIKNIGYDISKINHHIRVGIGRTGEILFFDGIHRLSIIKVLGLDALIPVQIAMIHKEFANNNSLKLDEFNKVFEK
jgi:hypothetical protein